MRSTKKGVVLALVWLAPVATTTAAEPSYLVYPLAPAVFRYDSARYEVLTGSDPRFHLGYAIGNQMLWDRVENRVPIEIYRAPDLVGFEPSSNGASEYVTYRNDFDVIIDGFGPAPRRLGSLCLRVWPAPASSQTQIRVNGLPLQGWTVPLQPLDVVTPVAPDYYADTRSVAFSWMGASAMRVIAFSDKDGDGAFQGTPQFGIVAFNATVPVANTTWGRVKALYR
jgi:hypothetical protein